jgi:hypothetical protein
MDFVQTKDAWPRSCRREILYWAAKVEEADKEGIAPFAVMFLPESFNDLFLQQNTKLYLLNDLLVEN